MSFSTLLFSIGIVSLLGSLLTFHAYQPTYRYDTFTHQRRIRSYDTPLGCPQPQQLRTECVNQQRRNPIATSYRTRIIQFHQSSSSSNTNNNEKTTYDLIVIGAGVVGTVAALTAAQAPYNKNVLLIDAPLASAPLMNPITNDDLSIGAPSGLFSKALRDTSKRIQVSMLRGMGLREDSVWNEIVNSCLDLASSNADDIRRQLSVSGVTLMNGYCSFPDDNRGPTQSVVVTNNDNGSSRQTLTGHNVLIATGSKPYLPSGIPFDGKRVFDSDSINTISYLPKSIVITGSGIIAVEFAKIFRNLGAEVTLVIRDSIPRNALMKIGLDIDVSALLVADLIRSGIKIERGAQVKQFVVPMDNERAPLVITLEGKDGSPLPTNARTEIKCDSYLAAVGRKPNTSTLNLVAAKVQVDAYGGIIVNSRLCTSTPNIHAAGDVVGRPFLASTGVAQALAAVNAMFSQPNVDNIGDDDSSNDKSTESTNNNNNNGDNVMKFDPASLAANPFAFPTSVWSSPEAAYYGYTSQQAKAFGINAGEGIALYVECLRGRVFSPNGLLKLVYDKGNEGEVDGNDNENGDSGSETHIKGRIIGVHICGEDACELIHYGMELVKSKRTIYELSQQSIFSAVTFHEMYKIAAQAALDEPGARKRRAAAGKALTKRNGKTMK
jgi:NAD(P) transhydrogenase